MYKNIDTKELDRIMYSDAEKSLTNEERLQLFKRATNLLKLKAQIDMKNVGAVIHQDEYYSYIYTQYSKPVHISSRLFSNMNKNKLKISLSEKYDKDFDDQSFMFAVPNNIIKYITFEKVMNKAESVRREYANEHNLDSDHILKRTEDAYVFFETLLRDGIESKIYLYNFSNNWFANYFEYSDTNKSCVIDNCVENVYTPIKKSDEERNKYTVVDEKLRPYIYGENISEKDSAILYMTKFSLDFNALLADLSRRTILVYLNSYDIFSESRKLVKSCMK